MQPRVLRAGSSRHLRVQLRCSTFKSLIDHELGPKDIRRAVVLPVEARVDERNGLRIARELYVSSEMQLGVGPHRLGTYGASRESQSIGPSDGLRRDRSAIVRWEGRTVAGSLSRGRGSHTADFFRPTPGRTGQLKAVAADRSYAKARRGPDRRDAANGAPVRCRAGEGRAICMSKRRTALRYPEVVVVERASTV